MYEVTCAFHKPFGDLASEEHVCLYPSNTGICNCEECPHVLDSATALFVLRKYVSSGTYHPRTTNPLHIDYKEGRMYFSHFNGTSLTPDISTPMSKDHANETLDAILKVASNRESTYRVELSYCDIEVVRLYNSHVTVVITYLSNGTKYEFSYGSYVGDMSIADGVRQLMSRLNSGDQI